MSSPGLKPACSIGLQDHVEGGLVRRQVGREAAFVADQRSTVPCSCSSALQRWKTSTPQRTASEKRRRAHRHDHELLHVDVVVGMRAAVDDVHHRHRQRAGAVAAQVAGRAAARPTRPPPWPGQRDGQDGVGPQPRLVRRAVQLDHQPVDGRLVGRRSARRSASGDLAVDVRHGLAARPCRRSARASPSRSSRASCEPGGGAGRHDGRAAARRQTASTSTATVGLPRESRIS